MAGTQPENRPKHWVLCSSGARPLYLENIVRVLGLPAGEFVKFRYEADIVSETFKKLVSEGMPLGAARVVGDIAYLAYLDNRDKLSPPRLYPVREAKIRSVSVLGTTYVIQLELLCFVDWTDNGQLDKSITNAALDDLPGWSPAGETDKEKIRPAGNWVAATKALPSEVLLPFSTSRSHLRGFESAVHAISRSSDFSDGKRLFVNFLGLYDTNGQVLNADRPLKAGQRYELRLYHFQGGEDRNSLEHFRLKASSDNDDVTVVGAPEKHIEARYDEVIFPFHAKDDAKSGPISLCIDVLRYDSGSTDPHFVLRGSIQRAVKSNLGRKIFFGTIIGVSLFGAQAVTLSAKDDVTALKISLAFVLSLIAGLAAAFQIKTRV